jgi:acetyl esterase/lipase
VRRRTLLGLPGLGILVAALSSCGEDAPVRTPDQPGEGRVSYGDDPSQYGELYLPSGTPRGVVVVIHGGFWLDQYDLELGRPLATSLAAEGWAAWNLEYRRTGSGGGDPATFDDVAAGIDKLADLDLDLTRVVTLGHSAGGHLATWAASRGRFEQWAGGVAVTHVISQAGVLDLVAAHEENLGGGAVERFLGHPPGPDDARLDPQQQVPLDVPVWCVHGDSDDIVPVSQSQAYVAAATGAGATAEMVQVDGDHFVVVDTTSPVWKTQLEILDSIRS